MEAERSCQLQLKIRASRQRHLLATGQQHGGQAARGSHCAADSCAQAGMAAATAGDGADARARSPGNCNRLRVLALGGLTLNPTLFGTEPLFPATPKS
jgi:hypothetical protein